MVSTCNGEFRSWTIITRGDVAQVLQAFCWGKDANLPWLLHENDGLRGAHVAITSPFGLRLLQVRDSSPVCTPAGDFDCEATELSCTDNSTGGNISLGSSRCLDKLPTETPAGSQALDRNDNNIETLLDLLPAPADQHVDVRSWGDAQQQLKERATPGSMLEAEEAWLRLIWLDATYKHLQPVHAILTKHGRRFSDLRPLVAAVHARCTVHCPAQDQQQQQQHNMHLLQDLLPASQCQELQTLLALVEAAVKKLHPRFQWLKQQLVLLVTKKLQLFQVQMTGLRPAEDPAPVPAEPAADQSANAAEDTVVAGVTATVHQTAAAKAADCEEQATSAVIAGRMKRPELADATGSVSKKQRNSLTCQTTLASQDLNNSLKAAGKQAWSGEPLPKQAESVAEAPAERPGVGTSQHQQVAGLAEQQVDWQQHLADCSSAVAASTATVAAPPSGANAGGSKGSAGASVKLPRLSYSGGARRAPVGSHITIKLAANGPVFGVNNATASALAAAATAAGAHVSDSAERGEQQLVEGDGVLAMAADAAASVDLARGSSGKPPQQPAAVANKQEEQPPVRVIKQQQQQSQPPATADLGGMLNKAAHEAFLPQQATGSMQRQRQQQEQASGKRSGEVLGAVKQAAAGVPAARAAAGTADRPSAARSADAAPPAARHANSALPAGRHTASAICHGGVAAASKPHVKQKNGLGMGSASAAAARVEASKLAAGNGGSKSMATNECVDGRHIVCTPAPVATQALKSTAPAASGAAAGTSSKPPDAAVARESADTAVAAAAKPASAADKLHAGCIAQRCSATSSPSAAKAADVTNRVTPAARGAAAVAPSSSTLASAEVSAVKSAAARTLNGRLLHAKRSSIPIPWSAVDRLASTPVAQTTHGQEPGAASGAGRADSAPPAKRARIPIPKPPTAGHNEPAAEAPAAAAGLNSPQYVRAAPSIAASRRITNGVTCSDSLAVAEIMPAADPVFLQQLTDYKARLRKYILQEQALDLGRAGNPQLGIMTPELLQYRKLFGYTMHKFAAEFLRDDFRLEQPNPPHPSHYVIVLRHNSEHQQQAREAAADTGTASVFDRLSFAVNASMLEAARSRSTSPAPEAQKEPASVAAAVPQGAAASSAVLQQRRVDKKQQQSQAHSAEASLSLPERLRGRLGPLPGSKNKNGHYGAADDDGATDEGWQPVIPAADVMPDLHQRLAAKCGTEAAAGVNMVTLATSAAAGGGNSSKGKSASKHPVQQHTAGPKQPPALAPKQLRQQEAANIGTSKGPASAAPAAGVLDHTVQIFDEFTEVWYYKDEGQVIGPKSIRMLRRLQRNLPAEPKVEMDNLECFTKQKPPEFKLLKHLLRLGDLAAPDV